MDTFFPQTSYVVTKTTCPTRAIHDQVAHVHIDQYGSLWCAFVEQGWPVFDEFETQFFENRRQLVRP